MRTSVVQLVLLYYRIRVSAVVRIIGTRFWGCAYTYIPCTVPLLRGPNLYLHTLDRTRGSNGRQ